MYSISKSAAKPIIAALPFNCSANRLKPNLVTTSLGWTLGCGFAIFAMIGSIANCKFSHYSFYGCLTRSASGYSHSLEIHQSRSQSCKSPLAKISVNRWHSTQPGFLTNFKKTFSNIEPRSRLVCLSICNPHKSMEFDRE
jgi:hypothetical protein